ncbi:hypothetical protein F5883DRAFT_200584 [Diaporthe sp. PMI_573]|nr:hypothetical protein F5883DRAFT_200584 [Diaporthaceae sp. PMI_573]
MQACCVAALIRSHLGNLLALPCTSAFCGSPRDAMPIFAGTLDGGCQCPGSLGWVQSRPAEMAANGLSIGARQHKGPAANLVVSALRESSALCPHRSDLCGLQRRESLGFAGFEAELEHGPGRPLRLPSAFSLGKPRAKVAPCPRSVGTMMLLHVNSVARV